MVEDSVETKIYPLPRGVRGAIISEAHKRTIDMQKEEKRSPLGTVPWLCYDSSSASFTSTFAPLLPEGTTKIVDYVEQMLVRKKGRAIGIEFGGSGSRLFYDFSEGFFCQTAGVTLADQRIAFLNERDSRRCHTVIAGDMFSSQKQQEVAEWLSGRKADVIFERMVLGLELIPQEPRFLAEIANNWYQMLAEGGVMFVQIPGILVPVMEAWKDFVEQKYPDQIQVKQKLRRDEGLMRLNKLEGAPARLPSLSAQTVRDLYRSFLFV